MDKLQVLSDMFFDIMKGIQYYVALLKEFIGSFEKKYGWQLDNETTTGTEDE